MKFCQVSPPLPLSAARAALRSTRAVVALLFLFTSPLRADEPLVTLSATRLNFPPQPQGTASSPQQIIITNTGGAGLIITSITITGANSADFTQTATCPASPAVLASGKRCEVNIVFQPKTVGSLSAVLAISDNASGSPHSAELTGNSTAPVPIVAFAPLSLVFGSQPVGSASTPLVAVLTNTGSAILSINSPIAISGPAAAEFRIQKRPNSCPETSAQLAPKATCEIAVIFAPATAGPKTAQITIIDDAAGSPQVLPVNGIAATQTAP